MQHDHGEGGSPQGNQGKQDNPKRQTNAQSARMWLVVFLVWMGGMVLLYRPTQSAPEPTVDISQVAGEVSAGQVQKIAVEGDVLHVRRTDGTEQLTRKESVVSAPDALTKVGADPQALGRVSFEVQGPSSSGAWVSLLTSILPMALFLGFILYMGRRQQEAGMGQVTGFARSKAKAVVEKTPSVTFADVAGVDEAKIELSEVVDFLRTPERFGQIGARIPKGVLLVGPPGTGKTLLARAVAGEAGVAFLHLSGSEFVEMFVGVGAARVRDLFEQAKRVAPCIVFIDEIDAIGRHRGAGLGGGNDEREQTLNQILVEMDGFEPNAGVVVLAATNRPDVLDPALLRPGRFDRQVVVDLPDLAGRIAILKVHSRGKPLAIDVDLESIARQTPGFSGADLANLLNEGALLAARRKSLEVGMADIEAASERVTLGPERRGRVVTAEEKGVTAYHEAGHALVARMVPHADPVHKITIVGRGRAGGYTQLLPAEERHLWSKSQFQDALVWILAGQAAEEVVFGEATTGASNDLERATGIARDMVTRYGMSEALGPLALARREGLMFLGRDMTERQEYSEETARLVDREVRRLVEEAKARAKEILTETRAILDRVANALVERETLDGAEFEALVLGEGLGGRELPRVIAAPQAPVPARAASTDR